MHWYRYSRVIYWCIVTVEGGAIYFFSTSFDIKFKLSGTLLAKVTAWLYLLYIINVEEQKLDFSITAKTFFYVQCIISSAGCLYISMYRGDHKCVNTFWNSILIQLIYESITMELGLLYANYVFFSKKHGCCADNSSSTYIRNWQA